MFSVQYFQWASLSGFAYLAVLALLVGLTWSDWNQNGLGTVGLNLRREVAGRCWFALTSKTKSLPVIVLRAVAVALITAGLVLPVLGSRAA